MTTIAIERRSSAPGPVVYSLLDEMRYTAQWRRLARAGGRLTAPVTRVVRRIAPTRRGEVPIERED